MGRRVHHWTDEHDAALLQAIQDCGPLFAHYPEQGKTYSESDVWHAVAGRLLPGVVVTGKAARRRWEVMQERDAERRAEAAAQAPPANDAWDRCAQMVDDYERSIHECNADDLAALRSDIADIRRVVIAIGRELGVAAW